MLNRSTKTAALVSLFVAGSLAMAACGDSSGTGGGENNEENSNVTEDGLISFTVPDGWVETSDIPDRWSLGWRDTDDEDFDQVLFANGQYDDDGAASATSDVLAEAQVGGIEGFRDANSEWIERDDDVRIRRTDFTYGPDTDDHTGVLWFIEDADYRTGGLQLSGKDLDETLIQEIEDSLTFEGGDAPAA